MNRRSIKAYKVLSLNKEFLRKVSQGGYIHVGGLLRSSSQGLGLYPIGLALGLDPTY